MRRCAANQSEPPLRQVSKSTQERPKCPCRGGSVPNRLGHTTTSRCTMSAQLSDLLIFFRDVFWSAEFARGLLLLTGFIAFVLVMRYCRPVTIARTLVSAILIAATSIYIYNWGLLLKGWQTYTLTAGLLPLGLLLSGTARSIVRSRIKLFGFLACETVLTVVPVLTKEIHLSPGQWYWVMAAAILTSCAYWAPVLVSTRGREDSVAFAK